MGLRPEGGKRDVKTRIPRVTKKERKKRKKERKKEGRKERESMNSFLHINMLFRYLE